MANYHKDKFNLIGRRWCECSRCLKLVADLLCIIESRILHHVMSIYNLPIKKQPNLSVKTFYFPYGQHNNVIVKSSAQYFVSREDNFLFEGLKKMDIYNLLASNRFNHSN